MIKIMDKFMMTIVPQVSTSETNSMEKDITRSFSRSVSKGVKEGVKSGLKGVKSFGGKFKSAAGGQLSGILGGVSIAGALGAAMSAGQSGVDNLNEQLAVADKLSTRAAQTGLDLNKFLKLQKLLEFSDVDSEAASQAIVEFEKRLGDFRASGANAQFFEGLGIKKDTDGAEAFLRAVSGLQNLTGAARNNAADKLFGGLGTEQLAEFLSGNLATQKQYIQGIDFNKLAEQVQKGSDAQSKLTEALVQSSITKLENTQLESDVLVKKIQSDADRDVRSSDQDSIEAFLKAQEVMQDTIQMIGTNLLKLLNYVISIGERFFNVKDDTSSKSDKLTD